MKGEVGRMHHSLHKTYATHPGVSSTLEHAMHILAAGCTAEVASHSAVWTDVMDNVYDLGVLFKHSTSHHSRPWVYVVEHCLLQCHASKGLTWTTVHRS